VLVSGSIRVSLASLLVLYLVRSISCTGEPIVMVYLLRLNKSIVEGGFSAICLGVIDVANTSLVRVFAGIRDVQALFNIY